MAPKRANWLHDPSHVGLPDALERERKLAVAHKRAQWLHNLNHLGGAPCLQGGRKLAVARKWAHGLHNFCRLGRSEQFSTGDEDKSGAQVTTLAIHGGFLGYTTANEITSGKEVGTLPI